MNSLPPAADRLTRTTYPDGRFATKTYDSTVGRLTSETDTGGRTIAYQYFADGKLKNYKDARLKWYNFEYDALRRLSKRVFPDTTFWQYTYDDAGQMATFRKATGVIATYSYDTLGRQTLTDWSDATPDTVSTYDSEGRLLTATHGASLTSRSYDDEGRLLSETQTLSGSALTYTYTYDTDGLPASMTRPDGSVVEYGYDARGWLADLTVDGPPPVVSYSHDARGRVTGHSLETGLQVVRDLDAAGQLESITNSLGATVLSSFTYGYDLAGQRTHVVRADGKGDRYAYDAARQVTGAHLDALSRRQRHRSRRQPQLRLRPRRQPHHGRRG